MSKENNAHYMPATYEEIGRQTRAEIFGRFGEVDEKRAEVQEKVMTENAPEVISPLSPRVLEADRRLKEEIDRMGGSYSFFSEDGKGRGEM